MSVIVLCFIVLSCSANFSFEIIDPINDEEVTYPNNSLYEGLSGLFDVTLFTVEAEESSLTFSLKFNNLPNPLESPFGFTFPLIHIYVHTQPPGSYRVEKEGICSVISNSKLSLDPRYSCSFMVCIFTQAHCKIKTTRNLCARRKINFLWNRSV